MEASEYLELFSSKGAMEINVKFVGSSAMVAKRRMDEHEMIKFINPSTGGFVDKLRFDGWLADIVRIEILPQSLQVIIHAKLPTNP